MSFTKKSFAIQLSKLKTFKNPKPRLEQYSTDSEIAAVMLWSAVLNHDVEGRHVLDLGAGTGILGLGALLLGAKKVTFVDIDKEALEIAKENYKDLSKKYDFNHAKVEFIESDIELFDKKADAVFQNPPFGVQNEHADKKFLLKAFEIVPIIYTLHKQESKKFMEKLTADHNFDIKSLQDFSFPLKQTMNYHNKEIHRINVTCFRLQRNSIF